MTSRPLKIAFMGTPDFAAVSLRALCESKHEVVCVYSQPPRPKGRGHKVQNSPVHDLALQHNIPVFTPKTLKKSEVQEEFAAQNVDVAVVAAYGLLLPRAVLEAPKYGCLNIHGSILPRWRGASPIQRAIWEGDEKSGITIIQMNAGMDTGDMIAKSELALGANMTASMLHDALADMGAKLILEVLDRLSQDRKLDAEKQDESLVTYAPLLKKQDGQVDWKRSAIQIDRQIRALNPWPGVWTEIQDQRVKILEAAIDQKNNCAKKDAAIGTILSREGDVLCGGQSILKLLRVQPEGKKTMDFASALNGGYISLGDIFK